MANGKILPPKWYNVNADARIWSGHAGSAQKQGWLRAPAAILAIDEYQGSYQFEEVKIAPGGRDETLMKPGYDQMWIRIADVSLEQYEAPDPDAEPIPEPDEEPDPGGWGTEIGDAELGAAVRVVVTKVASLIAPYFNR